VFVVVMEGVDEIVVVWLDVGLTERLGLEDELELELLDGLAERVMEELRLTVEELETT